MELSKMKWIDLVIETRPWTTTPIGPKYQADVPEWTGEQNKNLEKEDHWMGEKTWPILSPNPSPKASNYDSSVGEGRSRVCACWGIGSMECVNLHINAKKNKMKSELGEAYWRWKFDEMGEEVSKSWSSKDQRRFELLVKDNPPSKDKSFLDKALESFHGRSKNSIINYYYNVFILRRMSKRIRLGYTDFETEDEDEDEENLLENSMLKGYSKSSANKTYKGRYLTRQR